MKASSEWGSGGLQWLYKAFLVVACTVFFATGILKLLDLFVGAADLYKSNLAFPFFNNMVVYGSASILELLVAGYLLHGGSRVWKVAITTWIALLLGIYRILLVVNKSPSCGCAGNTIKWLKVDGLYFSRIMTGVDVALIISGSYLLYTCIRNRASKGGTLLRQSS